MRANVVHPRTTHIALARLTLVAAISSLPASATAGSAAAGNTPAASTAEQVIAKHVEARGGRARWDAVQTLRITGDFTAFSKTAPFTLLRKRPNRYLMHQTLNGKKVVIGNDGGNDGGDAWMDNAWMTPGAQPLTGADAATQRREFDFVTPLFDVAAKGYKVELLGDVEYEGEPAIGLSIDRGDGSAETWYLNPTTYLEMARLSPGSDFGEPQQQRTVFDDFRDVQGLKIPHFIESQFYTRDRVLQIDKVEIDVALDDALFRMPAPPGMGPFQPMVGEFRVAVERKDDPNGEWKKSEHASTITKLIRGGLLQERYTGADGVEVIRHLTYDSMREKYRMTEIEGRATFLDVQEGVRNEAGDLVLDNLTSGTTTDMFGMKLHVRTTLADIGGGVGGDVAGDGFRLEQEISSDGGANWWTATRAVYTRASEKPVH